MSVEIPNVIQALAVVTPTAFTTPGVLLGGAGFNAVVAHPSLGVYVLTLDQEAAAAQSLCQATPGTAGDTSVAATRPTAATVSVETRLAGALSDAVGFSLSVHRLPG